MKKLNDVTREEMDAALSHWTLPQIPESMRLKLKIPQAEFNLENISNGWKKLTLTSVVEDRVELEMAILGWLYDLVRVNIKRGRVFELRDVLIQGYADCLGYTKLLCYLGKKFALDIGIVEVIIDTEGRYTPHYVNLVRLSHGGRRFVDMWYGSTNIRHRRIGAQVKERGKWKIKDLDWNELDRVEDMRGLPQESVDAITYYILGNRHLANGISGLRDELDKAIEYYDLAIKLYPNARFYFNRAVAFENKSKQRRARRDYAYAFKNEDSIARILAREHEEIISLIEQD